MKGSKPKNWLIGAVALAVACVLQVIALLRYVRRLPDDTVGIVIYAVTLVAFALAAIGFFVQWKKEKRKETQR